MSLKEARKALQKVRDEHGAKAVLVMYSGGKDSSVCLDLASSLFDRVVCVFWYMVPGLECVDRPLLATTKRYNAELIQVPHFSLSIALKNAEFSPHRHGVLHTKAVLRYRDVEAYVREKTGIEWVLQGQRKVDSLERRGMLRQIENANGGLPIDVARKRVYPISSWSHRDVYAYVRAKKIALVPPFGSGRNSEVGFDPVTIRELKTKYPRDYSRFLEMFPYAEAQLKREEYRTEWRNDTEGV